MKRISFAIPVLCMVLFGCHQKNESRIYMSNDSCFQVISFNPDYHYTNLRFFNLSEVADTVEYIPLQTNEEITVGEVRKLLIRNGRMYIWDRLSESVFRHVRQLPLPRACTRTRAGRIRTYFRLLS